MSQEPEDVKPKLNLVIGYEGTTITVKVKSNMKFSKIFQAAEKRFGKESGTFKFVYDGERISEEDTPAGLGMEDGDQVMHFWNRKDKPLMKVFNVFAERMNMDRSTLRFSYNGKTVRGNEDDTADNLGMEEGDEIDAFVQQVGGGWNGI
ncbi:hypothetical protein BDQ17DRAFT_1424268 [Cyathus striatus]|nr:hypothetical protein BDQ17DRAFT_1424268 [Cyathus striatus]